MVNVCTVHQELFLSANNILLEWPFDKRTIITPDAAYGCETWPYMLTDEQRLKLFENGLMRKISCSNTEGLKDDERWEACGTYEQKRDA
jgi:hypothetical protein